VFICESVWVCVFVLLNCLCLFRYLVFHFSNSCFVVCLYWLSFVEQATLAGLPSSSNETAKTIVIVAHYDTYAIAPVRLSFS